MAEITANSSNKRKGFGKSIHRRSTRVDLTPMVDLGFLLLTFFVFTTSLAEAKAMTLIEPNEMGSTPVKESAAMTFLLSKNNSLFYYEGKFNPESTGFKINKTDYIKIRDIIMAKKRSTDPGFLMFIIKADTSSTLGNSVDLLDEMVICNIVEGHYAEMDITDEERSEIEKLN